jgi:hypothetical protein
MTCNGSNGGEDSLVPFSEFLDPRGRFVITNESDGNSNSIGNNDRDGKGHGDGDGNDMTCNNSDGGEDIWLLFLDFLDPGGRFAVTNKSVHCHHLPGFVQSDAESCHSCVDQISHQRITYHSSSFQNCAIPSWVHVFGKSTKSSSLRTQDASVVYIEQETNKKACHRPNCWAMKKLNKQHSLLTEATVPQSILMNLISSHEIDKEMIVFDSGAIDNPSIRSPDSVVRQRIPVSEG